MSELVCYCLRVDKSRIIAAIEDGCKTVDDLSARLRACTGCGGCRPDLEDLIRFYGQDEGSGPRPPRVDTPQVVPVPAPRAHPG